ncbi:hypothetical protein [Deinococcus apachensis]|uniref:hypothetical protein n=1 Tax=Deinococcus apachensis TaxID=309886 RepID=UPI00035DD7BC|nr:hypothetical protein [Deinococcus apachensis]
MKRTLPTLTALLALTLTLGTPVLAAGSINRPTSAGAHPAASRTISGTVTAAGGHSLKNSVILACPRGDCDSEDLRGAVIQGTGSKATFTIENLDDVPYAIYALQDVDGNEDLSAGDWVDRTLLEDGEATLVQAGTTGLQLELVEVKEDVE